jgi:hypothetical protein
LTARLQIRLADPTGDRALIESWIEGKHGQYILFGCATAQRHEVSSLLSNPLNQIGIISLADGKHHRCDGVPEYRSSAASR